MPRSRIIRMSFLALLVGVGLWGVLILPSFSQDPDGIAPAPGSIRGSQRLSDFAIPGGAPVGGAVSAAGLPPAGAPAADVLDEFELPGDFWGAGLGGAGSLAAGPFAQAGAGTTGIAGPPGPVPGGIGGMSGMGMAGMTSAPNQSQIEEYRLAQQAKGLLRRYSLEEKAELREKTKSELRAVLHRQFRLQHQRRDAELTKIEKRLADLRSRLKKRGDAQSTIVDRRLEQLVNDVDGLGWSAEEIPDNLFNEGGMGSMMMMPMGSMPGMGSMPPGGMPGALGGFGSGGIGGGGLGLGNVSEPEAGATGQGAPDPLAPASPASDPAGSPGSLDAPGAPNPSTPPANPTGTDPLSNPGVDAVPVPDAAPGVRSN